MKRPNDTKQPNPSTPSLGQTYRARSVLVWESVKRGTRDLGRNKAKREARKQAAK